MKKRMQAFLEKHKLGDQLWDMHNPLYNGITKEIPGFKKDFDRLFPVSKETNNG